MFSITDNNITLTRGDTLLLKINIQKNGSLYVPSEGDSIRFAMKRRYTDPDEKIVLLKDIPISTLVLEIEPQDTKPLPMKSKYVYDIQLTDADGHVDTFIKGTFLIDEEVL